MSTEHPAPMNASPNRPDRVRAAAPLAALVLAALASCGPGAPAFQEVDVPAVSISLSEALVLGEVGSMVPGADAGNATPSLGQVGGGRFLTAGGFVLANGSTTSLLLFDAQGAFEGEVRDTEAGTPPMERVHDVAVLDNGTLLAWDRALRRISAFNRAGSLEAVTEIRDRNGLPADRVLLLDPHRVASLHHEPPRNYPRGFSRMEVVVGIMDLDGNETARIGPLPGRALYGAPRANILVPFGERFLASAIEGRLFVGDGVSAELLEYDAEGHPVRRLLVPLPRTAITPADREAVRASYRRPTTGEAWMEALDASFRADSFPAFDRLVASGDGRLWLRRHGGMKRPSDWLAIDPVRREARPLSLPPGAEVLDAAGARILLLFEMEPERPEVRVHRLGGDA